MFSEKRRFGNAGEELAAAYLRSQGCRIIARNATIGRLGEIDIVARDGATLVFVEVKTRSSGRYGIPEDALTPSKRLHFRRAIHGWLQRHGLADARFRADVVAIDRSTEPPSIRRHQGVEL